jgi:hypothetical protein
VTETAGVRIPSAMVSAVANRVCDNRVHVDMDGRRRRGKQNRNDLTIT